jgi:hypothetical protein
MEVMCEAAASAAAFPILRIGTVVRKIKVDGPGGCGRFFPIPMGRQNGTEVN